LRIYLAAPSSQKALMPQIAAEFEAAGHTITERWWERDNFLPYDDPNYHKARNWNNLEDQAVSDYLGVVNADAVVVINSEVSEGKATEMGIAIALFKPIILIGQRSRNVFHYMPNVQVVPSIAVALYRLSVGDRRLKEREAVQGAIR